AHALCAATLSFCHGDLSWLFLQLYTSTTRALAGTCVGTGTLTAERQAALVAQAAIRSEVDQTLDRELDFTTQVAFDRERTHAFADAFEFCVIEFFDFLVERHAGGFADLTSASAAD